MTLSTASRQPVHFQAPAPLSSLSTYSLLEGASWGGFLGYSTYCLASSLPALSTTCKGKLPGSEKCAKVTGVAKTALLDLLSLGSSSVHMARWADEARLIALGKFLPLVRRLCCGITLASSGIEFGAEAYNVWAARRAAMGATSPAEGEGHKQEMRLALLKLVSHVSRVVWGVLEAISLYAGFAVSSALSGLCLGAGAVFLGAAYVYESHFMHKPEVVTA